jgi:hypothetical protein
MNHKILIGKNFFFNKNLHINLNIELSSIMIFRFTIMNLSGLNLP